MSSRHRTADTALPVELADVLTAELRNEYGDDERTHPVDPHCIPFTLNQLHSVNSTIQKRAAGGGTLSVAYDALRRQHAPEFDASSSRASSASPAFAPPAASTADTQRSDTRRPDSAAGHPTHPPISQPSCSPRPAHRTQSAFFNDAPVCSVAAGPPPTPACAASPPSRCPPLEHSGSEDASASVPSPATTCHIAMECDERKDTLGADMAVVVQRLVQQLRQEVEDCARQRHANGQLKQRLEQNQPRQQEQQEAEEEDKRSVRQRLQPVEPCVELSMADMWPQCDIPRSKRHQLSSEKFMS